MYPAHTPNDIITGHDNGAAQTKTPVCCLVHIVRGNLPFSASKFINFSLSFGYFSELVKIIYTGSTQDRAEHLKMAPGTKKESTEAERKLACKLKGDGKTTKEVAETI